MSGSPLGPSEKFTTLRLSRRVCSPSTPPIVSLISTVSHANGSYATDKVLIWWWPLSINGPKNNDKKMKWLVVPIGILVLHDVLLEEEREAHLMRFRSIRP